MTGHDSPDPQPGRATSEDVGSTPRVDQVLLDNIHDKMPELEELLTTVNGEWVAHDLIYRFWHYSFKVYGLQDVTARIAAALTELAPQGCELHPWFATIVANGTNKQFELAHNKDWTTHTGPIVEAYFHARHMLEMAVHAGRTLESAPNWLPTGWATLLELYGIR